MQITELPAVLPMSLGNGETMAGAVLDQLGSSVSLFFGASHKLQTGQRVTVRVGGDTIDATVKTVAWLADGTRVEIDFSDARDAVHSYN